MIASGWFQFGLGIVIINRRVDQEMLVKNEMKISFLSYSTEADIKRRWNEFQFEFSCCGLYGANSYKAISIQLPHSCFNHGCNKDNFMFDGLAHSGCFNVVKKLEAKLLDPVIILTLFCSVLQISNAFLALNLLRSKPKARRYHMTIKN
ncbi:uncharacterized protein LOC126898874 [Daktulosphaira vitifoliae]|uniref:uncharacterized protein LOC126898874 n=1 Tax=Daktulosphaira vitifoliae TaxID=58002 RepID=UPI0021AAC250|nr:uncharacterized protein LOC126898874 [Daktulosphaira vitifoliae]